MDKPGHKPEDLARDERHGFVVSDDLKDMPVLPAELDAVEAFLMAAFRAVMDGETSPEASKPGDCDSEQPQTHAEVCPTIRVRRRVR